MCQQVALKSRELSDPRLNTVLNRIRETHQHGGALFASFQVGSSEAFDWFASRARILEFGLLRQLLDRAEVTSALPALQIQPSSPEDPAFFVSRLKDLGSSEQMAEMLNHPVTGDLLRRDGIDEEFEIGGFANDGNFQATSSFLFDGELAGSLYAGGAYTSATGDGRTEKENALAFCEALFELRFSEVQYYSSHEAWTSWFGNIAWDWTAILFDLRTRALSILAITDSD
jgi:hypothetical protein